MHEIALKEYAHQIWKRRKIVLFFLLAIVSVTALVTWRQPRVYRAVTVVEIGAETPDVAFFQDVVNMSPYGWWSALKYYETQYQIIQSRSLLTKAAERGIAESLAAGMTVEQLTGHLQGGLSVGTDEKSRLANIFFDDSNPERAQKFSILIAETYVDENLSQKLQGVTRAVDWLNLRLTEIRLEKKKQEDELQKYKEEHKVVSLEDRENGAKANLMALTDSLNRLKSARIEVEAQYQKLSELVKKSGGTEDLLGVVSNDILKELKRSLAELMGEKVRLEQRYMQKHPQVMRVNAEIAASEQAIRQEVTNEVSRLRTRYLLAKAEEDSVARAVEAQKLEALKIEGVNRKLADIKVLTDTNQQLFETLQKKIKEADLSSLVRSNNIRIIDKAEKPGGPIRPDVMANLLLAVLIGLFGGVGLALLLEYLDDTFKTHEDLERYLKIPVLGIIPHHSAVEGDTAERTVDFIPVRAPTATISEFYRTLRTNVLFLGSSKPLKRILVVSTGPEEGKTVTAINLAVTLAQAGQKTILIDLDLRRPKLHTCFQQSRRHGVTNYLVGELTLKEAILTSQVPNLDYIVAGSLPPNPAELLGSEALRKLLEKLSTDYDRVIVDSSPIAPVTDALVLSQLMDGVILVVRAGKTHRKAVNFALDQLKGVKTSIAGTVLNDVDIEKSTYANYQYYKYGYYSYKTEREDEVELPPANA